MPLTNDKVDTTIFVYNSYLTTSLHSINYPIRYRIKLGSPDLSVKKEQPVIHYKDS